MGKVNVLHFVVTCNYQDFLSADKCVTYLKGGTTSVAVALEVERVPF